MSKKPQLKIDTDFYPQEQSGAAHHINIDMLNGMMTPENMDEKSSAAVMFERVISSNLAQKFISCWQSLKALMQITRVREQMTNGYRSHETYQQVRQYHRGSDLRSSEGTKQRQLYNLETLKNSRDKQKYLEQRENIHRHHRHDRDHRHELHQNILRHDTRLNRSHQKSRFRDRSIESNERRLVRVRSADLRTQISRAQILNRIADKLRNNNGRDISHQQADIEVIHRLSKLERMMKDIRMTNEKSNSQAIINSRVSMQRDDKRDMHRMLEQIYDLKKQIHTIKHYNQEMLKSQYSRSRIRDSIHSGVGDTNSILPMKGPANNSFSGYNFNYSSSNNYKPASGLLNFLPAPSLSSVPVGQPLSNYPIRVNPPPQNIIPSQHNQSSFQDRSMNQSIGQNSSFVLNSLQHAVNQQGSFNSGVIQRPNVILGGNQQNIQRSQTVTNTSIRQGITGITTCSLCGRSCGCPTTLHRS